MVPKYNWSQSKEPFNEIITKGNFKILSVVFKKDNKWKLEDTNTQLVITAYLKDKIFVEKINNHQVSFGKDECVRMRHQNSPV